MKSEFKSMKINSKSKGINFKSIFKNLEKTLNFVFIIPLIVYFLGFVFIQGTVINNITSISDEWYRAIGNISNSLYLISGIIQIIIILLAVFASIIMLSIIYSIFKMLKKTLYFEKVMLNLENKIKKYKKLRIILKALYVFIIICFICLPLYIINKMCSQPKLTSFQQIFFCFIFYFIIVILIYIIGPKALKCDNIKIKTFISIELTAFCIIIITLFVYCMGYEIFKTKIYNYNQGNDGIKISSIYFDDDNLQEYITIDISNDSFIGFDDKKNSIVVIPMDKIKSINTKYVKKAKEVERYDFDKLKSNTTLSDKDKVALAIKNYYDYRTKDDFSKGKEFIDLLSKEFYAKAYDHIEPKILQQKWRLSKKFNGNDIGEYLGISIGEPNLYYDNKNRSIYEVLVVEYWKGKNCYLNYEFVYEDNTYKINRINYVDKFIFK